MSQTLAWLLLFKSTRWPGSNRRYWPGDVHHREWWWKAAGKQEAGTRGWSSFAVIPHRHWAVNFHFLATETDGSRRKWMNLRAEAFGRIKWWITFGHFWWILTAIIGRKPHFLLCPSGSNFITFTRNNAVIPWPIAFIFLIDLGKCWTRNIQNVKQLLHLTQQECHYGKKLKEFQSNFVVIFRANRRRPAGHVASMKPSARFQVAAVIDPGMSECSG